MIARLVAVGNERTIPQDERGRRLRPPPGRRFLSRVGRGQRSRCEGPRPRPDRRPRLGREAGRAPRLLQGRRATARDGAAAARGQGARRPRRLPRELSCSRRPARGSSRPSAGGSRSRLGSIRVRPAPPVIFDQPTGVDVAPDGSLLVVEFGRRRLVRVRPVTGRVTPVATFTKPWGVARAPSGSIFVSDQGSLQRIDGNHAPTTVFAAEPGLEVGPVAVAPNGDVFCATAFALYRLPQGQPGTPQRLAAGTAFSSPHGLTIASDGAVLVADTNNNRILRVDPATGAVTTVRRAWPPARDRRRRGRQRLCRRCRRGPRRASECRWEPPRRGRAALRGSLRPRGRRTAASTRSTRGRAVCSAASLRVSRRRRARRTRRSPRSARC